MQKGWWGPVGPKLVLQQMASPVPEMMDTSNVTHVSSVIFRLY
jgi:hypothetical protein